MRNKNQDLERIAISLDITPTMYQYAVDRYNGMASFLQGKGVSAEIYEAKAKAYKQSKFYLTSALSELTDQGSQTAINRTNKILRAWTAWDKGSIEDRQLLLYELSERIWSITKKQES